MIDDAAGESGAEKKEAVLRKGGLKRSKVILKGAVYYLLVLLACLACAIPAMAFVLITSIPKDTALKEFIYFTIGNSRFFATMEVLSDELVVPYLADKVICALPTRCGLLTKRVLQQDYCIQIRHHYEYIAHPGTSCFVAQRFC